EGLHELFVLGAADDHRLVVLPILADRLHRLVELLDDRVEPVCGDSGDAQLALAVIGERLDVDGTQPVLRHEAETGRGDEYEAEGGKYLNLDGQRFGKSEHDVSPACWLR